MPKATYISPQKELEIIEFYKTNTARLTARHFNIRPSRLNKILTSHNIEFHPPAKTELTGEQISQIIKSYDTASDLSLCKAYHITKPRLYKLLEEAGILKHTSSSNRSLAMTHSISNSQESNLIDYYRENNMTATCRHFHINKATVLSILKKYNITEHTIQEVTTIKAIKQSEGLKFYWQFNPNACYKSYGKTSYIYQKVKFDSAWELSFWIWATDNNKKIERHPLGLEYFVENKKHYYYPDFLFEDHLIEIKGDHMLENGKLKVLWQSNNKDKITAKQTCIEANGVKILSSSELKFVFDYIETTYGKDYLNQFRTKQLRTKKSEETDKNKEEEETK